MANPLEDTIVAPVTAPGKAAVAILRLSGPASWEISKKIFSPWPEDVRARFALYGRFINGDDGLVIPFETGRSYTGEETVELNIHGSPASVQSLLQACLRAGARLAEPGEFTYRAFMNGQLDLTQAEGVLDTVESLTRNQLNQATRLRMGSFNEQIHQIRDACFGVLAMVEASVDFSDEIGVLDRAEALSRLHPVQKELQALITSQGHSQLVRDGFTLAILGRPNVGKSSLLNALLQSDRAIVTPIAGTTRDTVEEWLDVDGMMVRIIDTAGLRSSLDVVEQIGIDRALEAARNADLVWFLYDLSEGWTAEDELEFSRVGTTAVRVGNKADIAASSSEDLAVSAITGTGLPGLLTDLRSRLADKESATGVNSRHAPLLENALLAVTHAIHTLDSDTPDDLASVHLRDAVFALGQITGDTASEDMIQRIFRDFCIGK